MSGTRYDHGVGTMRTVGLLTLDAAQPLRTRRILCGWWYTHRPQPDRMLQAPTGISRLTSQIFPVGMHT